MQSISLPVWWFMRASASLNNTRNLQIIWRQSLTWSKRCFLDISKAFDRVWNDSLLYKLKLLGRCGRYYNLIQTLFRQQTSNGCSQQSIIKMVFSWSKCSATLSFYINDLPKRLRCNAKLFAGDTSLYLNNH